MFNLSGKLALVTGASRGIGAAIARKLASAGAKVAINYNKSEEKAKQVLEEILADGGSAFLVRGDVSEPEDLKRIHDEIAKHGKVSILINNAGITKDRMLARMSQQDWDATLKVNLFGTFLCTKEFIRDMMALRWGRIINISSVVALMGSAGQANYCASKAGIIGFTKAIAREYAKFGITANVVAPGYIETDMTANLPERYKKMYIELIPLGRAGKPDEVANAVLFLASEEASYITGTVLNVSGGMYM